MNRMMDLYRNQVKFEKWVGKVNKDRVDEYVKEGCGISRVT